MGLELKKFIVCDDVRVENTGKLIIIGMYSEDKIIVHSSFPYTHPSLSLFLYFQGPFKSGELFCQILTESGEPLIALPPVIIHESGNDVQTTLGVNQLVIPEPGAYKVSLLFPHTKTPFEVPFYILQSNPPI